MATQDDKMQLLQNTQALMVEAAEASRKALAFSTAALDVKINEATKDGPRAKVVELGIMALKEGVKGCEVVSELAERCIEIAEALEDMYGAKEKHGGSG
jgi:hypothetical protein